MCAHRLRDREASLTRIYDDTRAAETRPGSDYRVSDAERDAVLADLRSHTAAGRLSIEEFSRRTDEALAARTGAELREVFAGRLNVTTGHPVMTAADWQEVYRKAHPKAS